MKEKNRDAVAIIGGADEPTSIFIAGRTGKRTERYSALITVLSS